MWASPRDAGTTEASVVAFVEQLAKAHVNTLVMELKTSAGLFWPSERFAPAVVAEYKRRSTFPPVLIRECHKRKIAFHVWFFDFAEGGDSYVVAAAPGVAGPAARRASPPPPRCCAAAPTGMAWMCPARRPGYTDQWLIPLIKEFAERYDVDAIHHDYVRYPGDLAPDTLLLLRLLPRRDPAVRLLLLDDPPRRPAARAAWTARTSRPTGRRARRSCRRTGRTTAREMKSRLLLEGSFFPGGNRDLDYFFYEYRAHHVAEFTREVFEEVREGQAADGVLGRRLQEPRAERALHRPGLAALRAVGPVPDADGLPQPLRGRLRDAPRPAGREHPAAEGVGARLPRTSGSASRPTSSTTRSGSRSCRMRRLLRDGGKDVAEMQAAFDKVAPRLADLRARAPRRDRGVPEGAEGPRGARRRSSTPSSRTRRAGYYPPERLTKTLERVRAQDVEGVVIFSTGGIASAAPVGGGGGVLRHR